MAIRISKHQLYIGAAGVAVMAFFAVPAQAQYHTLKSQEPQVELNLDRLSSGEAGPAARPLWEPKAETPANQVPAGTPPIKLRQPLRMPPQTATLPAPSVADVPVAAAQQPHAEPAAQAVEPAATTEAVGEPAAAARVLKPIFAAPVVPPAAAEPEAAPQTTEEAAVPAEVQAATPAVNAPAVPVPTDNPVPAAPVHTATPALKPAKLMDPILEPEAPAKADKKSAQKADTKKATKTPDLLPVRKPEVAEAAPEQKPAAPVKQAAAETAPVKTADKSVMSYPPASKSQAEPVKRYERPVLPQGMGGNYAAPAPNTAAPAAPVAAAPSAIPPQPAHDIKLDGVVIPADIQEDPTTEAAPAPATAAAEPVMPAQKPEMVDAGEDMPETVMNASDLDATPAETAQQAPASAATAAAVGGRRPSLVISQDPAPTQRQDTVPARMATPSVDEIAVPTMADLTLEFDGTSSELSDGTQQKLVNIIPLLKEDQSRRLAVHAYASGEDGSKSSARRISLSRALAVRSFLMDNGVKPTRVDVRALGLETDRKPLERVDLVFAR